MSDNDKDAPLIPIVNMRSFFNREIFMHALGDIRFKQPIALKQALYTVFFLATYSLPLFLVFGFGGDAIAAVIYFGPPIIMGRYANKPIWGGRTLIDFVKVSIAFMGEPKGWTECLANNELNAATYHVDKEIWVSRRKELQYLADLREQREGKVPRATERAVKKRHEARRKRKAAEAKKARRSRGGKKTRTNKKRARAGKR